MRHALLAAVLLAVTVPGQARRGNLPKPSPDVVYDVALRDYGLLVVKFTEGTAVRLRDGQWVGDRDLAAANALLRQAAGATRLFQRPEAALDQERAALLRDLPATFDPPADLNHYYHVRAADDAQGRALLRAFLALDVIETAFPEHRPDVPCDPGDIEPRTPSFRSRQDYRDPPPTGVDHRASRVIPGGRGEGLQVIDIESSWQLDHEDIPQLTQAAVIGAHTASLNPNHGVATVGELAAEWDEHGVDGLVDLTGVKVHSHLRQFWASSVNVASANSPVGGFIMLEVQLSFMGRTSPMESRDDVFDAVRAATMAGRIVVAAAGNGSQDLDNPVYGGRFNRSVRDSGSIIVGATSGAPLVRASFSNFGSVVDANGWGGSVTTTGYGDLFSVPGDPRQSYTSSFSGTSSATPIVTGVAMAMAGAVREQLGRQVSGLELRNLLRENGTPVPGGSIGPRPDLERLLAALGLPDGLDLPVEAGLGETLTAELTGTPGTPYAVAASTAKGFVDLGAAGRFLLDPSTAVVAYFGVVPASGTQSLSADVPNVGALAQSTLYLQGALMTGGQLDLTSSVANYVF
ncbi:MAG: S8 family serine peptidase [Planctomycetota bacterium]